MHGGPTTRRERGTTAGKKRAVLCIKSQKDLGILCDTDTFCSIFYHSVETHPSVPHRWYSFVVKMHLRLVSAHNDCRPPPLPLCESYGPGGVMIQEVATQSAVCQVDSRLWSLIDKQNTRCSVLRVTEGIEGLYLLIGLATTTVKADSSWHC